MVESSQALQALFQCPGGSAQGRTWKSSLGIGWGLAGDMSLVSRNKDSDRLGPSGATSRSLKRSDARTAEGQLTFRALLSMSSGPTRSRKKKKKKGKDTLKKLKEVLTGKKDKDRKKRKRRRQSADGDPDDGGGSSGEESESSTSSGTSRCSEESSKLMAPLKRLSSRQPGAVLQKLVEQVEQQMREFCEPTEVEAALTSGVRLVSLLQPLAQEPAQREFPGGQGALPPFPFDRPVEDGLLGTSGRFGREQVHGGASVAGRWQLEYSEVARAGDGGSTRLRTCGNAPSRKTVRTDNGEGQRPRQGQSAVGALNRPRKRKLGFILGARRRRRSVAKREGQEKQEGEEQNQGQKGVLGELLKQRRERKGRGKGVTKKARSRGRCDEAKCSVRARGEKKDEGQ